MGGFPRRVESEHDVFDGGHAGTGLSIAQGLATARDLRHGMERVAVVVGDAALMSGLSLEALNDIGQRQTRMLIVLNDNEMSISPTVGALSKYLSQIKLSNAWRTSRTAYDRLIERAADLRRHGARAVEAAAQGRRELRPAGPALRGSRDLLRRRRAGPQPARPHLGLPARARAARARCWSTSGRARAAATAPPRSTRSASTAPRCRRWRRGR